MTQVLKYQSAVHTFQTKYNCIPGDCANAGTFGFPASGQYEGEGDGNGYIEGVWSNGSGLNAPYGAYCGESVTFWVDLSMAGFVDGNFTNGSNTVPPNGGASNVTGTQLPLFLPSAKIGNGNYVSVFSANQINYFALSAVNMLGQGVSATPGLSVSQAYNIDKKIDDGLPMSGSVMAAYITNANGFWNWANGVGGFPAPYTSATQGTSSTCYDNSNANGGTQNYSTEQSGGSGMNCALSFKFQ